jgi:hypothetical protein
MNMSNFTAFAIIIILVIGGIFFQYKNRMRNQNIKPVLDNENSISETIVIGKDMKPVSATSGLTISYSGARSRSYVGGGGSVQYDFTVAYGNEQELITFTDTTKGGIGTTISWKGYNITYIDSDQNSFTFKISVEKKISETIPSTPSDHPFGEPETQEYLKARQ